MAYLGKKTGQQMLAAENRRQATLNQRNADVLDGDPVISAEVARLRVEADRLIAEAAVLEVTP